MVESRGAASIVREVRHLAQSRLADPHLDSASVARALGLSRASLYRLLRAAGAPAPAQIIRHVRLNRGLALLLDGGRTVSEVAVEVGFSSLAQFSRTFKQAYGVAPSAVRRCADTRDGLDLQGAAPRSEGEGGGS